jgi:hypothetical protein
MKTKGRRDPISSSAYDFVPSLGQRTPFESAFELDAGRGQRIAGEGDAGGLPRF